MLTEQEAVERAWAVIRGKGITVTGLESVRKVQTAQMPPAIAALGDIWAVSFGRPKAPGERSPGTDSVFVRVLDRTGEATLMLSK